jgi:anti-sigma-K factor RskA
MTDDSLVCIDPSWQDLAPLYALDALDDDERRGFETHLTRCAFCRQEVAQYQEASATLAADEVAAPPPELKSDVLAAIRSVPQLPEPGAEPPTAPVPAHRAEPIDLAARRAAAAEPSPQRTNRTRMVLAVAAAVLVAGGGFALFRSTTGLTGEQDRFAELAATDDVVVTELAGADLDGGGAITITWSPSLDEVAVEIRDLAPVADDETYALWLLSDDDPVPAALFPADADGLAAFAELDDLDAAGWGISIEPAGGSPQPTTEVLFSGLN